ncbi:MAG: glycosyltransferase family 2 protein [Steroidobacteraceae bacterium]
MPLDYVLITPARNEAEFIERTIESVVQQTVLPRKWVIVSDGSTDDTDRIVERHVRMHHWMELVRRPIRETRNFAAKVEAFNAGFERVGHLQYEVIGNIDADVSFESDYFEYLLKKFESQPELGVAGTHYLEGEFHSFRDSYINPEHVNGQCQLFRRRCFEDIGGYVPIEGGGIDWVAVTTARMRGWKTRSFDERVFHHHRKMGTAGTNQLGARFHYGKKDYFLGSHPLWELLRGGFQMTKRPYVVGGMALLTGYAWCCMARYPRAISSDLVRFHRREQMTRLRSQIRLFFKRLGRRA